MLQVDNKIIAHTAEVESILRRWKHEVVREVSAQLAFAQKCNPSGLSQSDIPGCSKSAPHGNSNVDATSTIPHANITKENMSDWEKCGGGLSAILKCLNMNMYPSLPSESIDYDLVTVGQERGADCPSKNILSPCLNTAQIPDSSDLVGKKSSDEDPKGTPPLHLNDNSRVDDDEENDEDEEPQCAKSDEEQSEDSQQDYDLDPKGTPPLHVNDNSTVDHDEENDEDEDPQMAKSDEEQSEDSQQDGQDDNGQESHGPDCSVITGPPSDNATEEVDEENDEDEDPQFAKSDEEQSEDSQPDGQDDNGQESHGPDCSVITGPPSDNATEEIDEENDEDEETQLSKSDEEQSEDTNGQGTHGPDDNIHDEDENGSHGLGDPKQVTPDNSEADDSSSNDEMDDVMDTVNDKQCPLLDVIQTVTNKVIITEDSTCAQKTTTNTDVLVLTEKDTIQGTKRGRTQPITEEANIDGSNTPVPAKRRRVIPKRYRQSSQSKIKATIPSQDIIYSSLGLVDPSIKKRLLSNLSSYKNKHYVIEGHPVKKTFFTDLLTPKKWVDTMHMEALLSLVWRKLGNSFIEDRIAVLDSWFIDTLCTDYTRFQKKTKIPFSWSSMLRHYVRGNVPSRSTKMAWYSDVDTIYAPMRWGGKGHWVTLVIQLRLSKILILDPLISANAERKMNKFMKPVVDMLPHMIRDLVSPEDDAFSCPESFTFERLVDLYQNERTGDCGPVSVKFIELHAQRLDLDNLTDTMVDHVRFKYAVDAFEEFVHSLRG